MRPVKRERWLDICKGYLIIMVVIGHVVSAFQSANMYVDNQLFTFIHSFAYSFHMATFFFISGYIYQNFGKGNLSLGQKIQKRLIVYGIPYIVFSIVYYLVKIVLSSFVNTTISLEEIVFIPVKPFGYLWFVYALMFMEILQDIVEHVFTNKKKSVYVGKCLFLFAAALCIVQYYLSMNVGTAFTDYIFSDFMRMWVYFIIGVYGGKIVVSKVKNLSWTAISLLLAVSILINILVMYKAFSKNILVIVCMALIGGMAVIAVSLKTKNNSWLEYLGKVCFPIYLLHDYVLVFCRIIVAKMTGEISWWLILIVSTILAIVLPIIIYQISCKLLHLDFVFHPGRYLKTGWRKRNEP